jgi:Secretion system C-terminal sorting domain
VHSEAINNLNLAKSMYTSVIDANEKTEIEIEINKAFPMESGLMRDFLVTRSPLSDDILKESIGKLGLLDDWHLTQVLLANSPLTKEVMVHLEQSNILNEFFMSFIYEADITGTASYRRLLEYEIAARESERHLALMSLLDYYNRNADQIYVDAAVKNLMLIDGSLHANLWLLEYYINTGAHLEAVDIIAEIQNLDGMADFAALKQIQLSLGNDWTLAHPEEISNLEIWSSNPKSSAYGQAISVLHTLELTDVLPEPELPFEDRGSMTLTNPKRTVYLPELSAYPNPASDHTFVNYPSEADGIGTLEIYSPIGQLLDWYALNDNGVIELNTQVYPAGIYLLTINVEGKSIVDCKLVVTE